MSLPSELISDYFLQEHFSLKYLMDDTTTESGSKYIIHTRSDAEIFRLPTAKIGHCNDGYIEILRKLVHDQAEKFVIAHLCALKNEATVRSIIDSWAEHETVHILLLIVDMSESIAIDRINFIRCCIDQIALNHAKKVVLLLHYSPAAFVTSSFYPALFLDEWKHQFLDSVGDNLSSLDVKGLIQRVCLDAEESQVSGIDTTVKSLLQSALKSVANWNTFYNDQEASHSFHQRYSFLVRIFSLDLHEGTTIQHILATRFATFWTKSRLSAALKEATHNIKQGNSQLPITAYLRSFLHDAMHQYLMYFLVLMNEWKNFDVLDDDEKDSNIKMFFHDVLFQLPSLPFKEMVLHRVGRPEMKELPAASTTKPLFPFFSQVSETLDQVVESTLHSLICKESDVLLSNISYGQILGQAMALLSEANSNEIATDTNFFCHKMSNVVLFCLKRISEGEDKPGSLYHKYLEQYMGWKLCCDLDSVAAKWFQNTLKRISESIEGNGLNIILIHIVARRHEMEILRLNCTKSFPIYHNIIRESELGNLDAFVKWFWDNVGSLSGSDQQKCHWISFFSSFLNRLTEILQNQPLQDEKSSDSLRRLSFLYILIQNQVSKHFFTQILQRIIQHENNDSVSLGSLLQFLEEMPNDDVKYQCIESTLQHFFSPIWLSNIYCRWEEDLKCLISVSDQPRKYQLCLVLIRNACFFGSSIDEKILGKKRVYDKTLHISISRLNFLSSNLECEEISNFSDDGNRASLPHYIPPWMRSNSVNTKQSETEISQEDKISLFFSNYHHSFHGDFVNIMFDLVLAELAQTVAGESSERLLLILWKDIEIEFNLKRNDQVRFSRMRSHLPSHDGDNISFKGSPLSILIIEAWLLLFVLQVSYELATTNTVAALNGTYSDLAYSILNHVMSLEGVQWQEVFFLNIIRLKGKGFLINLLRNNDMLKSLPWTIEWRNGLPDVKEELEDSLRLAEASLQEATYEEQRKSREFLLCPHCRQPFAILARNCGQFVCGRANFHNGQHGQHGCGQTFTVDQAQPYNVDNGILEPLKIDVEKNVQKMQEFTNSSHLWEVLDRTPLPFLVSSLEKYDEQTERFLPTSFATITVGNESELLRHLMASRTEMRYFSMLPDLIEFYNWTQFTFKFLVTFDEATTLHLDSIMNENTLIARFDSFNVKHILSLWRRLREHLDYYLENNNYEVQWDCERIKIPFSKTADVSLIMMLSAYEHPTEGYDYLFIIINDIIGRYNYFVMKLNEYKEASSIQVHHQEINPTTMIPGSPGAISLSILQWIASTHFDRLVERFRGPKLDEYDVTKLEQAACQELSSCEFTIQNPIKLWRQFNFRLNYTSSQQEELQSGGHVSSEGFHFIQLQDFQLFEDCKQYLKILGYNHSDHQIRHLLQAKLNDLSYEQLRSCLAGFRGFLQQISESENSTFDTIDEILFSSFIDSPEDVFEELGFLELSNSQIKTILSLKPMQLVEAIQYAGYQLASEGHLFASLPLSMNTPMTPDVIEALELNILELADSHGHQEAVQLIHSFKTDILCFYQNPIRDECSSSNQSLRTFLEENNFCDSSDPIFSALPLDITIRNFIPLQQSLHQLRLRFASYNPLTEHDENDNESQQEDMNYTQTRRGRSWLWSSQVDHTTNGFMDNTEDDEVDAESIDTQLSDTGLSFSSNGSSDSIDLWFENGYRNDTPDSDDDTPSLSVGSKDDKHDFENLSFDLEDCNNSDNCQDQTDSRIAVRVDASLKIQKWWRSQYHDDDLVVRTTAESKEIVLNDSNCSVVETEGDKNTKHDNESVSVANVAKISKSTVLSSTSSLSSISALVSVKLQRNYKIPLYKMVKIAFSITLASVTLSLVQLKEMEILDTLLQLDPKQIFSVLKEMLDVSVKVAFCIFVCKYVTSNSK